MKSYVALLCSLLVACTAPEKGPDSGSFPKDPSSQPNILLIMVDDLNDRLGCYGDSIAMTPHIDLLASQGALFQYAYCQQPLCGPSRTSLLTGRRPHSLGIHSLNVHFRDKFPHVVTLPQAFHQEGYFTARVGKIFHQGVPDAVARQTAGADDSHAWDIAKDVASYELNHNGHYYNATPWKTHGVGAGGSVAWLRAEKGDDRHHDYNVATEIIALMDSSKGRPFFLAAGFIRPHVPLVAPKRFFEQYDSIHIPLPDRVFNDRADMPEVAYDSWAANFDLSDEDHREAIRSYYACVSFVDEQVGRLMKALEKKGLAERTIILFVSDHGYQLGHHGLWFKNYLFRESVISPMMVKAPGIPPRKVFKVVELLDIYPSLLELAGLRAPDTLEGASFVSLMKGKDKNWKNHAVVACRRDTLIGKALYQANWSYMDWGERGEELYDLQQDPGQFVNLAKKDVQRATSMKEKLKQILRK